MNVIKRKVDVPKDIHHQKMVALKAMGNIMEISISDRQNCGATIVPMSKDEYVLLSTGEVKEFEHHAADRTENLRNLEKTMRSLSDLINVNISPDNVECCRFLTFTFRENMTDAERLYTEFKNFNKRFKRYMAKLGYHYEYIVTIEAQARGAFHLHGIFIFDDKAPYIENKLLADMWLNGFVSVKAIDKHIDDLGRYLTAYLTDLPVENEDIPSGALGGELKEIEADGKSKRVIKGARLKLLPVGIRIYRYSRGVKKPIVVKLPYGEAVDQLTDAGYSKVNEYAVEITDIERDFKSKYIKQTFKKYINPALRSGAEKGKDNEKS